jgi:hypothetical protein
MVRLPRKEAGHAPTAVREGNPFTFKAARERWKQFGRDVSEAKPERSWTLYKRLRMGGLHDDAEAKPEVA